MNNNSFLQALILQYCRNYRDNIMDLQNNIKILVIDDEKLIGISLKHALEKVGGYAVDCVFNGSDAIESLEGNHYDIVITDLNLPDYKEFELVKAMRELDTEIPLLVMSACYPDSSLHDIRSQDVFKCFNKPFEVQDVLSGIKEALASQFHTNPK
jgi:two-component system response regulator HydG